LLTPHSLHSWNFVVQNKLQISEMNGHEREGGRNPLFLFAILMDLLPIPQQEIPPKLPAMWA